MTQVVDSIVQQARGQREVPGGVIAIVGPDTTVLRGFGFARLADSSRADPERTIYRLASVAKLFVVTTVLRQVELGHLDLDLPIAPELPDVALARAGDRPITLRDLLTHTAGFDERVIGYAAPSRDAIRPLGEYLAARMPPRGWPAGTLVGYSNHGMALAALVAERNSGTPFRELAQRELFGPLGMSRTYYVAPTADSLERDLATGYRCGDGCSLAPSTWSHPYPVGLAFSTAADMARFMRMQLDGGALDGARVLDSATLAEAHRRQFSHHRELPGIALGFFEQYRGATRLLTHAGGVPGAATVLALVPSEKLGIFIATNAGEPIFTRMVMEGILDATLGPLPEPRLQAAGPVAEYAGPYLLTRYSHSTIERLLAVFAFPMSAWAVGDTLVVPLGAGLRRFVRIDSLLLADTRSGTRLALRRGPDGRITHLFTGLPTGGAEFPAAFERVPWYQRSSFLNEYASALVGIPLIVLVGWGLIGAGRAWLRRDQRRAGAEQRRQQVTAIVVAVLAAAGFCWLAFGFVAAGGRGLGRGEGLALGVNGIDWFLLRLAWPLALAAVPIAGWCLTAWRKRWWSLVDRLAYSILAVFAVGQAHFLVWWGYVPGRW